MNQGRRGLFIKNAFILTGSAMLLRLLGMFYQIYMSNRIGAAGMGLYQLIHSVYILFVNLATSGITIAVTRLIAENMERGGRRAANRVLRRALLISGTLSIAGALFLLFGADLVASVFLKDLRSAPALRILAPSLPLVGVSCCLRGYFTARRKVSVSSNAQIFEQLVRIAIGVTLLNLFADKGLLYACAAVVIGNTVSEVACCSFMLIGFMLDRKRFAETGNGQLIVKKSVTGQILAIAAPIAAIGCLNTLLRTIENLLVPNCLTKYTHSRERSLAEFGMLKGMAMPLLFFPSSFLAALATLLVPEIAEAYTSHKQERLNRMITTSMHITIASSILIGGIFFLFSTELGVLIYKSEEVGFLLRVLAPIMPFMYLESIADGILKGLNQQVSSLKYSVADSVIRIAMIFLLVPVEGMKGFLLVMVVSNLFTAFMNVRRLLHVTGLKIQWGKWVLKPGAAMVFSGIVTVALCKVVLRGALPAFASVLLGILTAAVLYCGVLLLTGCVTISELAAFRRAKRS